MRDLIKAIDNGKNKEVASYIKKHPSSVSGKYEQETPLHRAVVACFEVNRGIQTGRFQRHELHPQLEIVKILLKGGANPLQHYKNDYATMRFSEGYSPLFLALEFYDQLAQPTEIILNHLGDGSLNGVHVAYSSIDTGVSSRYTLPDLLSFGLLTRLRINYLNILI